MTWWLTVWQHHGREKEGGEEGRGRGEKGRIGGGSEEEQGEDGKM